MNLRSALKVYKRDAVRNALVSLIEDRLDARIRENVPCGRGWVGNKGKGKKCKRAPKGSAAKQMRVKRKRLGKSAEPPKARVKAEEKGSKKPKKVVEKKMYPESIEKTMYTNPESLRGVRVGDTFRSRDNKAVYRVTEIKKEGFVWEKNGIEYSEYPGGYSDEKYKVDVVGKFFKMVQPR